MPLRRGAWRLRSSLKLTECDHPAISLQPMELDCADCYVFNDYPPPDPHSLLYLSSLQMDRARTSWAFTVFSEFTRYSAGFSDVSKCFFFIYLFTCYYFYLFTYLLMLPVYSFSGSFISTQELLDVQKYFVYIDVCTTCVQCQRRSEAASDPLEIELKTVVNYHIGAGD